MIQAHRAGDVAAYDQAVSLLYEDLHRIAHQQLAKLHGNDTLQTTAVVNEAYLKLRNTPGQAVSREHFLGIAAKAMRHVIIDYARSNRADKRGGDAIHVELDPNDGAITAQADQLLMVDQALEWLGANNNPRLVKVFECKFFAGLNDQETAQALDLSLRTAQRDWLKARAFLGEYLAQQ